MEILIGTANKGKLLEYQTILADTGVTLLSLVDVGLADMDVAETGETFHANAELKALAYAEASGKITFADDSGLCVDALGGAPGVYSARYGGAGLDNAGRRQKLLKELDDLPLEQRTARFECVIALAEPGKTSCLLTHGICQGKIAFEEHGTGGFGYDALFIPDGYDQTFGELSEEVKNRLSHRGEAARQLIPILMTLR